MPSFGQNLLALKANASSAVNRAIGEYRLNFITDIPGQQAIYQAKRDEAVAFLALDPVPSDPTGFPLLTAETGLTAPTAAELAQLWLDLNTFWVQVSADLEAMRITAIQAINAAANRPAIDAAVSALEAAIAAYVPPSP